MLKEVKRNDIQDLDQGIKVINFHATWCGPCKLIKPVLESLDTEYPEVSVYRVDVDIEKDWTKELNVHGTPTTFVYQDGKIVKQIVGYTGLETFKNVIDNLE